MHCPDCEKKKKSKAPLADWLKAGLIVLVFLFLFRLFRDFGFLGAISAKNVSVSYGVSFLVGLVASVSSCLAVVGAVVIAFS